MFDETNKYQNHGHFFFQPGDNLREASGEVPNLPGVYIIYRLAKGKVELVYIGRSGSMLQSGTFKNQLLRQRLNNEQEGIKRQLYFEEKMKLENIDALDIYWYITMDENHNDLPGYVEGLLMQRYFEVFSKLPSWNRKF